MSAIKNLIEKTKGNKVLLAGTVIGVLALVLIVGVIAGSILIFGLNLMGFVIPYTMKTIFGAAIVISCLRSMGSDSK
jgi:fucose permease